jgi:FMN phosphatase YigB (HAD superfamily)
MKDKIGNIEACVFDAYGTLFDVMAAAAHGKDELGEKWEPLAEIWRTKQLNYTWLRSLMDDYVGFWQVTEDALSLPAEKIYFMSSNPWDMSGGANFGFKAVWINRLGQRKERLPGKIVAELTSLQELPTLI